MLRSLIDLAGYHLAAIDGEIGHVEDFLFDDETWVVEYLVVDIRRDGRKVLILPFALGSSDWESHRLAVALTCEQIRTGLPLQAELPVSLERRAGVKPRGSHLTSLREMVGYTMQATDGDAGVIEDFIAEDTLWGVHHVVVGLRRAAGRLILLPSEAVRSISWQGQAARVSLTLEEIERSPDFDATAAVNQDSDYYGRPLIAH
jgi:hypothetical protein